MLCVTLEGYFPVDGCKFRESFHSSTEDQQLAVVKATQFVLGELKNYHKVVVFTSVHAVNVDSLHRNYGRGVLTGSSEENFKAKSTEHHASQAAQKVRHDPFTEAK